jgi:hypothetical protein
MNTIESDDGHDDPAGNSLEVAGHVFHSLSPLVRQDAGLRFRRTTRFPSSEPRQPDSQPRLLRQDDPVTNPEGLPRTGFAKASGIPILLAPVAFGSRVASISMRK